MAGKSVPARETARLEGLRPEVCALILAMLAAAAFYFPWRVSVFNPGAPILSSVIFAAEVFGAFTILLHLFMTSRITVRTPPAPLKDVTVDIFVTTYNEPVAMLRRTLAAAKLVRGATRVVLLDDGNRPPMARLADELGVAYLARSENTHAKAGNLNNALAHSTATYIATFDADHAPAPDFLERTLGYFRYEYVAFVQTPQDFYNLDSFQHRRFGKSNRFWTEQSLFFRVVQPGKDRWNAAFFCGSCAVLRRVALDRIGGFATGTVTEDIHTSLKLHKAGYQSVYHNESLAYGVAAASYEPYQTQRIRWGEGAMQVWRKEKILFTPGLTLAQRLCYLASVVTYFEAWQKALFYALPPLVLFAGVLPLAHVDWQFAARFAPWFVLSLIVAEELGRGYARLWLVEQYNFLRMPAFLRATLALFRPGEKRFRVTRKAGIDRHQTRRQVALMALVPLAALAAIPVGVLHYLHGAMPIGALIGNALWAALAAAIAVAALRFAWRSTSERRADYRFAAPLPFDVHLPSGGWGTLRALDITSDGVRLAAPVGLDFAVGRKLDAVLHLPSGAAKVLLRIKSRTRVAADPLPQRMELGCELAWTSPADQDRLNALLYGAGLEHRLLEISERGPTPLQAIAYRKNTARSERSRHAWATAAIVANDNSIDIAAQPLNSALDRWRVLSYQPLPANAALTMSGPSGGSNARLRVLDTLAISSGPAALHVATIDFGRDGAAPALAKKSAMPWLAATAGASMMALLLVTSSAERAEGDTLVLAGAEAGGNSNYAYAGVIAPLPGQRDGQGWAARFWGDRGEYSYDSNGQRIDAETHGAEAALVRRASGAWGYANVSAGVRVRDTDLSPNDPGNKSEGAHTDIAIATDGRAHVTQKLDATWLASRELDQRNTLLRAGLDRDMGAWRVGADITHVSGRDYAETKLGPTAQVRLTDRASLTARAGVSRNDDGDTNGYAGLGLALNLHR